MSCSDSKVHAAPCEDQDPELSNKTRRRKWAGMTANELKQDIATCIHELFQALNRPFFQEVYLYQQFSFVKAIYMGSHVDSKDKSVLSENISVSTSAVPLDESNHIKAQELSPPSSKRRKRADSVPVEAAQTAFYRTTTLQGYVEHRPNDSQQSSTPCHRTWGFILNDLAYLAPFMTPWEHEWVSFLASVCLLSYLVPNCRNLPFLSTHLHKTWTSHEDTTMACHNKDTNTCPSPCILSWDEIVDALIQQSLPTDRTAKEMQPPPLVLGPLDDLFYASFLHFVHDGLAPWLQSRHLFSLYHDYHQKKQQQQQKLPLESSTSIDMFHDYPHSGNKNSGSRSLIWVLSMAIISNQTPSTSVLVTTSRPTVSPVEIASLFSAFTFSDPTIQQFLASWVQLQWKVPYIMRVELVHILSKYLILPCLKKESDGKTYGNDDEQDFKEIPDGTEEVDPQILEILQFLRLALQSFELLSLSSLNSSYAHQALIKIAMDTLIRSWVDEAFQNILKALVTVPNIDNHPAPSCKCIDKWLTLDQDRGKGQYGYLKNRLLGCSSPLDLVISSVDYGDMVSCSTKSSLVSSTTFPRARSHRLRLHNHLEPLISVKNIKDDCTAYQNVLLLEDLIIRYNRTRQQTEDDFNDFILEKVLSALKKYPQFTNTMDQEVTGDECPKSTGIISCTVAALLRTISTLFYFLIKPPSVNAKNMTPSNDLAVLPYKDHLQDVRNERIKDIVSSSIQWLYFQDATVISSAASLIHNFLCFSTPADAQVFGEGIKKAIQSSLRTISESATSPYVSQNRRNRPYYILENLLAVSSKRCGINFIDHLITLLLSKNIEKRGDIILYRILVRLSKIHPAALLNQVSKICSLHPVHECCLIDLIITLMTCQTSRKVDNHLARTIDGHIEMLISSMHSVTLYPLANEALCVSNFSWARKIYDDLLEYVSSTNTYMWLSALIAFTEAEILVKEDGLSALPTATSKIDVAIETLRSLSTLQQKSPNYDCNHAPPFSFQISFLCLRRDLLNSILILRLPCHDTTRNIPNRKNPSTIHQRFLASSFIGLTTQIFTLYKRFGLFACHQTRTILRSLYALCRFLGCNCCTQSSHASMLNDPAVQWPRGDSSLSIIQLIADHDLKLLEGDSSLPLSLLIKVTDTLLLEPIPYPRYFFSTKSVPMAFLRISSIPFEVDLTINENGKTNKTQYPTRQFVETVNVLVGSSFRIYVDGLFSSQYMNHSTLYFSQVALWYTITYNGVQETSDFHKSITECLSFDQSVFGDVQFIHECDQAPLHPGSWYDRVSDEEICGSKFSKMLLMQPLHVEGVYTIRVNVGIRDRSLGEYEAMTDPLTNYIIVHTHNDCQSR